MGLSLRIITEKWPISGVFTISRGAKTEAQVVVAELSDGLFVGRGECVPYARYGENVKSVVGALDGIQEALRNGLDREKLQDLLPAGAARNALDCAFWDLEAKQAGRRAYELAGLPAPRPLPTVFTISLGAPEVMGKAAAKAAAAWPQLKIKLGDEGDPERLRAVRLAAPQAQLFVDANEGWNDDNLAANMKACAEAGVKLVEQPLPAGQDDALRSLPHAVPVCADESLHDRSTLQALSGKYDVLNIKLDKAGGLTEALALADLAARSGFSLMVGCMVSTSLAIAPAVLAGQKALIVDLDGPRLLAHDRPMGLLYESGRVFPPEAALWG